MKRFTLEFLRRGIIASGIGPIILALVYLILQASENVYALTVNDVTLGIFSLFTLAFIAGGMNAIYQIERLPLMTAVLIHGIVLYIGYLITYLINDWLDFGIIPIIVFSGIFVVGYVIIWSIIYFIIRKNTARINEILKQKQTNM